MASNFKDGSNYIDGVPVKISTKFLPPNPVTIPVALDTKFSTELLAEQYDFSLERKVVEHHTHRLLELQEAKNVAKKAANPDPEPVKPQTWQHSNTILQPSPQQPVGKTTNDRPPNDTKINLSDFENDTSSPFDYMELQTINDLEELNSVFQGMSDEKAAKIISENAAKNDENVAENRENAATINENVAKSEENVTKVEEDNAPNEGLFGDASSSHGTTVSKSLSFPTPQKNQFEPNPQFPHHLPSSQSETFSHRLPSNDCQTENFSHRLPSNGHPISFYESSAASDTVGYSTLSQVPYIASNAGAPAAEKSLRGSKSYSDIPMLSDDAELMDSTKGKSWTPPSYCSLGEPDATEDALSLNEDHFAAPPTPNESSNGVCHSNEVAASAYEELDEASRGFVDSLTEMGFPQGQVARAVKHLGTDEKKVVEHLCQIQALEESGYESMEAEAALHLHDYNRDQAKEFLDLVNQFQDLGFEKDAVKKALVQNKNDWNKTIDALLP